VCLLQIVAMAGRPSASTFIVPAISILQPRAIAGEHWRLAMLSVDTRQCRLKVAGGPGPHFGWGPRPGPHFQTISLPFPSRSSPSHGSTLPSFPFPSLPSPSQASLPFQFPSLLFSPPLFPSPSLRSRLPVLSQLGGLGERGRKRKHISAYFHAQNMHLVAVISRAAGLLV